MKQENKDGTIPVYEYWSHEHMEVKLRPENFEKYINKIGETRRRYLDKKKKEAEERKAKDKDKE
jgi:hypothetical protein